MKNIYRDMFEMEKIVRASDLNWTIIQPYYLTDRGHTGVYRIEHDKHVDNATKISREDVGDLMVKEATSDQNMKKAITIGY